MKTKVGPETIAALLLDVERRESGPAGVNDEIVAELRVPLGHGQRAVEA
jgi:hypothetical protein